MAATATTIELPATENPQFTCISCSIAFVAAEEQRDHYKSDHHRYNMKRRVAGLPPVSAQSFSEKVLQRRAETAFVASAAGRTCKICKKVFTSENSYRSHIQSKKHRNNELAAATALMVTAVSSATATLQSEEPKRKKSAENTPMEMNEGKDMGIEAKLAASRNRLTTESCLFCKHSSSSIDNNLGHMGREHGFFVPDTEYLIDLPGLLTYLGEKVAIRNVCLYCNGKGRELHSLEAVRKHMTDKSHCKIAYDSLKDRLDISDFYDFTSSYDGVARAPPGFKRVSSLKTPPKEEEEDSWEDDDDIPDDEVDEVVSEEEIDPTNNSVSYGDTPFELVLPSGVRIGHRSMKRYYAQNFRNPLSSGLAVPDPNSGSMLVKRLLADKKSDLIPASGAGFGADGNGMMTMRVRNRGEAKEAGRHIREHRDQRKQEAFRTKIGFISNNQKHFRDPLLQ
ncbi:hypothetical protein FRB96_000867 [Tulasnella sp. 330]|nr:hypothetical protein FRB96_000867 [Tulasnella sp. 330]KAG8882721.1 hypothetical protein FRB97_007861 [Tulasnella sp. 331]KAG8888214.1 hypothetical protein FRB98_008154 [Tulasnella sp. 332]